MCGRFTRDLSWADVVAFSRLAIVSQPFDLERSWNQAPSQPVPVIRAASAGFVIDLPTWGFSPAWANNPKMPRPINARAEGIAEKPIFRSAFASKRCLVPASGWYEWRPEGKFKQPYYFHRTDEQPLMFAGIWENSGEQHNFAIVTTAANDTVAKVHDRMPVILHPDQFADWLTLPGKAVKDALQAMLVPCPPQWLAFHAVSRAVNAARRNDAALIEPAEGEVEAFRG